MSLGHGLLISQERGFLDRKLRIPQGKEPSRHAVDLAVLPKPGNDHYTKWAFNYKHFGDMYTKTILKIFMNIKYIYSEVKRLVKGSSKAGQHHT